MAFFLVVGLAISLLGWGAYTSQAEYLRQRQYQELRAIANFKAAQIEDWLAERRGDAEAVLASRFVRSDFSKWLENHDATSGERLRARLESLRVYDAYANIELLDEAGIPGLVVGSARQDSTRIPPAILYAAAKTAEPQLIDLYRDGKAGPIQFAYLLAIPRDKEAAAPMGYLRLTIDPEKRLYPLLQSWPTPSPTAETMIVRREGEKVVYLNTLRHRESAALDFGMPLARTDLPAARAAEGGEGIFEGEDYRGVRVLSYLRPIAGTPWRMVAKVDRDEVFQSIDAIARLTVAATAVLLLFTGMMLRLWSRRQQMSAQLHFRRELERIADVSPGIIFSFCQRPDGSTAIPYASAGIRDVFGLAPEEVAEDAGPFRFRIPAGDNRRLFAARKASASNLSNWRFEFRYRHPEKGEIWVEGNSVPTRQPDGSIVWNGFAYDITERKRAEQSLRESEARFSTVFRESPLGIAITGLDDGFFVEVNDAFLQMFGMTREGVIGRTSREVELWSDPSDRSRLLEKMREERTVRNAEVKLRHPSGKMLDVLYSVGMIDLEGKPYLLSLISDITTLRQAETALKAQRDRLETEVAARTAQLVAANKELQAFAYAASHDLKAPLRGISGFASLLESEYRERLEGNGLTYLDHISSSAARMASLIDDLLAYARLEQATQQLEPIDLPAAVQSVIVEHQEEIRQCSAEIRLALADGTIQADMHGLIQVLRNLLGNALKYSAKADHPLIVIGGEPHPGCYRFWLRDNGTGFDMAYHDQIFDIFRRLHSSRDFPGTGVGLALVRKAMERMGGRVWAESAPGKGATFFLEFQVPDQ